MHGFDTPDGIAYAQLCARKGALKLEGRGLRHSSGKSMLALCKREYGLKGNREQVLAGMQALIEQALQQAAEAAAARQIAAADRAMVSDLERDGYL